MKQIANSLALSIISSALVAGCSPPWSTELQSGLDNSSQCTPAAKPSLLRAEKSPVGPFQRTQRKVIWLNEQRNEIQTESRFLAVQVDLKCLQTNTKFNLLTDAFRKLRPKDFSKFSSVEALTIEWPKNFSREALESLAERTPCLLGMHEDSELKTQTVPNDLRYSEQSHLQSIRFDQVFEKSFLGPQSIQNTYTLAVIDDGFLKQHPDLINQWWTNPNEIPGNQIDDDQNGIVDDVEGANFFYIEPRNKPWGMSYQQHGTHVAGLAAAQTNNTEGISSPMGLRTKILPIAMSPEIVMGGGGTTFGTALARALRYAADHGASVINISMMVEGYHPIIEEALIYATQKGTVVVVAAGNNSKEMGVFIGSPAVYGKRIPGMLAVGASNSKDGNLNPEKCQFSNYSTQYVEIFAPGCDSNINTRYGGAGVLSCIPESTEPSGYGWIQGTSMASPIAAAGALYASALLQEHTGQRPSAAQVEQTLVSASRRVPALEPYGLNGGHLDLEQIWISIKSATPENPDCP